VNEICNSWVARGQGALAWSLSRAGARPNRPAEYTEHRQVRRNAPMSRIATGLVRGDSIMR
jgi:hypothetical protein